MKKILFVLAIVATAYHSKAQEQFSVKPADSLTSKLWSPAFTIKPTDSAIYKKYFNLPQLKPGTGAPLIAMNKPDNTEVFYSTMPVVKIGSVDKMKVVKPNSSHEKYTMPVKKIKVVNPLEKKELITP
jgi:hypothetical protein